MIVINRRKYLAELGKLLTFMYEEDRQEALALYEQLFDAATDETELIKFLGSPTKQAVLVAHAYNANNRKLTVNSREGAEFADVSGKEIPPFVKAINDLFRKAEEIGIVTGIEEDIPEDLFTEEEPVTPEKETEENRENEIKAEIPAEATGITAESADSGELTTLPGEAQEFISSVSAEEELQALFAPSEENNGAEKEPEPEKAEEAPAENYTLDLGPVPEPERSDPDQIDEVMAAFRKKDEAEPSEPAEVEQTTLSEFEGLGIEEATPWRRSYPEDSATGKANIPIMICYLIASVPLTAAGVLILLIPALLFFALSVACGIFAFYTASSAFGNFAVFADIMVVLGGALVFAALSLFFFWIFLWFIIGAIAGLINFSIRLGQKICFMEGKQA